MHLMALRRYTQISLKGGNSSGQPILTVPTAFFSFSTARAWSEGKAAAEAGHLQHSGISHRLKSCLPDIYLNSDAGRSQRSAADLRFPLPTNMIIGNRWSKTCNSFTPEIFPNETKPKFGGFLLSKLLFAGNNPACNTAVIILWHWSWRSSALSQCNFNE